MNYLRKCVAALFIVLAPVVCHAQGTVCRLDYIDGFLSEAKTAKERIGKATTTNLDEAKVFITTSSSRGARSLYIESNFVSVGANRPTKIAVPSTGRESLLVMLAQIYTSVATQEELKGAVAAVKGAHASKVQYYIDQHAMSATATPLLDLDGAGKLFALFEGEKAPAPALTIAYPRGPPIVLAECRPSLFVRVTPAARPATTFDFLSRLKFDADQSVILALTTDTATIKALQASRKFKRVVVAPPNVTREWVLDQFKLHPGLNITAVGHVDGGAHVIVDATGQKLATVPIAEMEGAAAQNGNLFVDLGCFSAAEAKLGAASKFNSLLAVERLEAAQSATDMEEYLGKISSPQVKMVVEEPAVKEKAKGLQASLIGEDGAGNAIAVASVSVFAPEAVAQAPANASDVCVAFR